MQKINRISLSRLLKLELPTLAENVIEIIEDSDSELLKIKEAADLLIDQVPQINLLKLMYGPHQLTKKADALRVERKRYTSLISLQMSVLSKADIDKSDESVGMAQAAVDLYLKKLGNKSEAVIYQQTSEFFRAVDSDEPLEEAFTTLGLSKYLDNLRSAHSSINEVLKERKASIARRPNVNIPPIARSVTAALRNLFNQINLAQERNPNLNYSELIAKINQEIKVHRSLISMRATIIESKKAEAEEIVDNEEGDVTSLVRSTKPLGKIVPLNGEEIVANGNDLNNQSTDKDKLSATSSKPKGASPINHD